MLKGGVSSENRVVGLHNRVSESRGGIHTEFKLGLLAIVGRQALKDEGTETGSSSSTEGVEDEESLQARAVVCQSANPVHHIIDLLLPDGVMTTSICQN